MKDIRFSLVVPTCERHETLYYTLLTLLSQKDFDDYEIIVCDNFSSDETKSTVDTLASSKIKYVRSHQRLAMSDNWELALSKASGEYITVIGDDDGLLSYALKSANALIEKLKMTVIRYSKAGYSWPEAKFANANQLSVPLGEKDEIFILDSFKVIKKVIDHQIPYDWLPMLYNSFVHRDLVEILRSTTGRVFHSHIPDIYSGFAIAYLSKKYASTRLPLGIAGRSRKSTSYSLISMDKNTQTQGIDNFVSLWTHSAISNHSLVPDYSKLKTASVHGPQVAEPFMQVKDRLFPEDKRLSLNRKWITFITMKTLKVKTEDDWNNAINTIRESLSNNQALLRWFDSKYLKMPPRILNSHEYVDHIKKGFDGDRIYINAAEFGVTNILGAAEVTEKILPVTSFSSLLNSNTSPFSLKRRVKKSLNIIIWNPNLTFQLKLRKIIMIILFGDGF